MKNLSPKETISKNESAVTVQLPDGLLNITMGNPGDYSPFADGSLCSRLDRKPKPICVLLADNRIIVRQGLCAVLALEKDISVVGQASNGQEAVELTEKLHPDVVIISFAIASLNRMHASRRILQALPAPRIIILARHDDDTYAKYAATVGAAGCVTEQIFPEMLVRTLRETHSGSQVFSAGISRYLSEKPRCNPPATTATKQLTPRQKQVLQLIAEGNTNKQTAFNLSIGIKTVEKHRERLMARLGIHETAGLTRYAISSGIVGYGSKAQSYI
jgi:DNA-binding NarL/FixJ family response regulator